MAIDLKSFYASVECVDRHMDPLTTNLVVADPDRTEKTICLAVSPALKAYGIPGRPRLFEVVAQVKEINETRRAKLRTHRFSGSSSNADELKADPSLELTYEIAKPRMATYMRYSTDIYKIYLKYISADDIHVYSCDEVFMDVTQYLDTYNMDAHQLTRTMIQDVLDSTGITATAGIGSNMFLAKIAMDIEAKHIEADADGVRIAQLDERTYREKLWNHRPITDFWRVGRGTARKLEHMGIYTMGDIALQSEYNEESLYKAFGVNAELLIDHAWGWEPCTIEAVKQYKPENNSLSSGQVLQCAYDYEKARIIVKEMADQLALDLVDKGLITDQLVLTIGYDVTSLDDEEVRKKYKGEVKNDWYGREVPKHATGTVNLEYKSASSRLLTEAAADLYDKIINKDLLIRRINISACQVTGQEEFCIRDDYEQLDLFTDYEALEKKRKKQEKDLAKELALQKAALDIRKRFGNNAILKGSNLEEGSNARQRNEQIGGHHA